MDEVNMHDFVKFWCNMVKGCIPYTETREMNVNRKLIEKALFNFMDYHYSMRSDSNGK